MYVCRFVSAKTLESIERLPPNFATVSNERLPPNTGFVNIWKKN